MPISRQIAEQLRSQCLSGTLIAGDKLPSVRELAQQLAVNVNTVFRIYERLAAEGLIELRHGDGTYVCPKSLKVDAQLETQRDKFGLEFDALIQQGVMLGFTANELRTRLTSALATARNSQK
ncbi:MAG: GntR family transcriptional regulator [Planctomycetes bacterium]|nr:GntR family transcriptional regulator [Planctomycetota bacterium]